MKFFSLISYLLLAISFRLFAQSTEIDSALRVLSIQKNDSNKVNTINFLCWKYSDLGEVEKTMQYAQQAIKIASEIGYKNGARVAYNEIALVYINTGNYPLAIENLSKTLSLAIELNDSISIAKTYNNFANIYNRQSKYKESLYYYQKALKLFEYLRQDLYCSQVYNNVGTIYLDLKVYDSSLKNFNKALHIRRKLNYQSGIAETLSNIGFLYFKQDENELAQINLKEALSIFTQINDSWNKAKILMNLARYYQKTGAYNQAIDSLSVASGIFKKYKDFPEYTKTLLNLSFIHIDLRNFKKARDIANEALIIAKEINEMESIRIAYSALSVAEEELGNLKEALQHQKLFKLYSDSIFNTETSNKISELKTNFEVVKKEEELKAINKIEQTKKDAQIQRQKTLTNSFIVGFILMIALAITIYRSYLQRGKANKLISKQKLEVEQQKEIVEHQNEEILASITYAKRIQSTILPPPRIVKSYLPNSFILYLPKDIVAGDFYWMESIERQQNTTLQNNNENTALTLFAACDCTGHGVPGALVSVVCSNALNRVVKEYRVSEPAKILDRVCEIVVSDFSKDENENVQDGMDISICALDKEKMKLYWAGANNPLWIIRNEELIEYKADKQPVGKYEDRKPFTNHVIALEPNDSIYIFTDGFADQFGGEKNKKLTKARFKELLLKIQQLSSEEQRNYLYTFLDQYRGNNEQVDDILVIGVKV